MLRRQCCVQRSPFLSAWEPSENCNKEQKCSTPSENEARWAVAYHILMTLIRSFDKIHCGVIDPTCLTWSCLGDVQCPRCTEWRGIVSRLLLAHRNQGKWFMQPGSHRGVCGICLVEFRLSVWYQRGLDSPFRIRSLSPNLKVGIEPICTEYKVGIWNSFVFGVTRSAYICMIICVTVNRQFSESAGLRHQLEQLK